MKKLAFLLLTLFLATPALAEVVTLKIENPTDKRLWLADIKKP
ncbi:hypothetical protein [Thermodesulfatator autotrophicus]|nr:hypothetical protein [Thermodesulfatator autotrophicus]